MRSLIILVFCATALAERYVDKEYLIGLKAGSDVDSFIAQTAGVRVMKSWDLGMTVLVHVRGDDKDVLRAGKLLEVKYLERNGIASIDQCSSQRADGCWGLDRTDQRQPLGYTDPTDPSAVYNWGESTGAGVNAFVLDTGIDITHSEFGGRASWAYTASGITPGEIDGNGHGTHCAGTIGSDSYGVAKEVSLNAVKVLQDSGSGPWTSVVDGMDWVRLTGHSTGDRSVINLSVGGSGVVDSVFDAVEALYQAGVVVSVSAGNSNIDACNYSPAGAPNALTIGASDVGDASASFTNWGTCVDIFAPGVSVLSTAPGEGTDIMSGTSMSSPHVVGVVARFQSSTDTAPSPAAVAVWLTSGATPDALSWTGSNHDQSPNLLLFADCPI